jgi:FMN reductase
MSILIISTSLNPESSSRILAQEAYTRLEEKAPGAQLIDLRDHPLPLCDGAEAYQDPALPALSTAITQAQGILLATPIYNFDAGSAAKNLIELTSRAWSNKLVGFLCAAGGQGSYMSIMSIANSLMLDFRCYIVPRFVYATGEAFKGDSLTSDAVHERLDDLTTTIAALAPAIAEAHPPS